MIEKMIFNLLAFSLFILMFLDFVRKNDANYLYLLVIQFIGIAISFVELVFGIKLDIIMKTIMYFLAVVIPIVMFLVEYKFKISFTEILYTIVLKINSISDNSEKEEKYLADLIKKYPDSIIAHKKLAEYYEKNNNKEEALEEYEKVMTLSDDKEEINDYNLLLKVAKLCKECQRYDDAKEIFYDILKEQPECYDASMMLGDLLFNNEDYKEATLIYMNALKYNPLDYDLYYNLGMTYTMLNDFQKANESYKKAAEINSASYHAQYNLGQISLIYGDLKEAKEYFEECINCDEVEANAYYYLAKIAIIEGNSDDALNYANIAVEDDNNLYEKFQNDEIFITIKNKIRKPNDKIKCEYKSKFSIKEVKTLKHLFNTCKIVGKLNNNDIQMIENLKKNKGLDTEKERQ